MLPPQRVSGYSATICADPVIAVCCFVAMENAGPPNTQAQWAPNECYRQYSLCTYTIDNCACLWFHCTYIFAVFLGAWPFGLHLMLWRRSPAAHKMASRASICGQYLLKDSWPHKLFQKKFASESIWWPTLMPAIIIQSIAAQKKNQKKLVANNFV